jgi:hypothetical protein
MPAGASLTERSCLAKPSTLFSRPTTSQPYPPVRLAPSQTLLQLPRVCLPYLGRHMSCVIQRVR